MFKQLRTSDAYMYKRTGDHCIIVFIDCIYLLLSDIAAKFIG